MSTRVGTLQAPKAGGSIVLAAFLASLVMLTIAVVAISLDRDQGQRGATTFVGRHVVNTPTELSGGIVGGIEQTFVGGTAANTPSELRGATADAGGAVALTPHVPRRAAGGSDDVGTSAGNTPSELSGGLTQLGEARAQHQRI